MSLMVAMLRTNRFTRTMAGPSGVMGKQVSAGHISMYLDRHIIFVLLWQSQQHQATQSNVTNGRAAE